MGNKKKKNVNSNEKDAEENDSQVADSTTSSSSVDQVTEDLSKTHVSGDRDNKQEATNENESNSGMKTETKHQMQQRHKQELKDLKKKTDDMVKNADGPKKKDIKQQVKNMETEMADRHQRELKSLDSKSSAAHDESNKSKTVVANSSTVKNDDSDDEADGAQKVSRAKRKKASKEAKEEQRVKELAEAKKNRPKKDVEENAAFYRKLAPQSLRVKPILSDGNCLFNSIADQVALEKPGGLSALGLDYYRVLRHQASDYMWKHREEFMPFVETEEEITEDKFRDYCHKMATTATWGGQLELRALAQALASPIIVYMADGPDVHMGDEFKGARPLRVSYHKHAFAAGEHYNSVVPLVADEQQQ